MYYNENPSASIHVTLDFIKKLHLQHFNIEQYDFNYTAKLAVQLFTHTSSPA